MRFGLLPFLHRFPHLGEEKHVKGTQSISVCVGGRFLTRRPDFFSFPKNKRYKEGACPHTIDYSGGKVQRHQKVSRKNNLPNVQHRMHTFSVNSLPRASSAGLATSSEDRKKMASASCAQPNMPKRNTHQHHRAYRLEPNSSVHHFLARARERDTTKRLILKAAMLQQATHLHLLRTAEIFSPSKQHPAETLSKPYHVIYI